MSKLLSRKGFTLIELLVVLGIIGLLAALILAAVQAARESARRADCQNKLRQLALATESYEAAKGRLPMGRMFGAFGYGPDSQAWSWLADMLPFMEETTVYNSGSIPNSTIQASSASGLQLSVFLCPSDSYSQQGPRTDAGNMVGLPLGQTNYKAVCGANWGADKSRDVEHIGTDWPSKGANGSYDGQDEGDGPMFRSDWRRKRSRRDIRDGTSKTFLIGEVLPDKDIWCSWPYANNAYATCAIPLNVQPIAGHDYSPAFWPNSLGFRSLHSSGGNFALADGSVRFVANDIDLNAYRAMATIAGGENISD